jgi:type IV secretory pathway VirB10-like protein
MSGFHDGNGAEGAARAAGAADAPEHGADDGQVPDVDPRLDAADLVVAYRTGHRPNGSPAASGSSRASNADEASSTVFPVPERPPLPKPERLNRNALTVAAVVMGTLVLAAVIFMPPSRPAPGTATSPAPIPATATFLDQPVAGQVGGQVGTPSAPNVVPNVVTSGPGSAVSSVGGARRASTAPDPYAAPPNLPAPAVVPTPSPTRLAYEAALEAPLTASEARQATNTRSMTVAPVTAAGDVTDVRLDPDPAASTTGIQPAPTGPGVAARLTNPTGASGHERFLANALAPRATTVRTSVATAPGPYALLAGTMIPAVLVTELNSDLPGEVLAQVARDVYDSRTQRDVLVPKGARLLGTYEHEVGAEQRRLLVAWTRLIFPDGRSVVLPALPAKDRSGAGGLADHVDRHESRVFGTAALLSLVGAGAQLAQPNGGYGVWGGAPSTGQAMAGAVGQQLADVATQMLRRDLDVRPTIHVRQGMPFNVFLNVDLTFPAPYGAYAAEP